jgi:ribokinase
VITLGSKGCVLLDKDGNFTHFKGKEVPKEKIADTTGAGDSFIGSLAYFMACKRKITDALQLANYIASISIQSYGTQISYPDRTALSFDDAFR